MTLGSDDDHPLVSLALERLGSNDMKAQGCGSEERPRSFQAGGESVKEGVTLRVVSAYLIGQGGSSSATVRVKQEAATLDCLPPAICACRDGMPCLRLFEVGGIPGAQSGGMWTTTAKAWRGTAILNPIPGYQKGGIAEGPLPARTRNPLGLGFPAWRIRRRQVLFPVASLCSFSRLLAEKPK